MIIIFQVYCPLLVFNFPAHLHIEFLILINLDS